MRIKMAQNKKMKTHPKTAYLAPAITGALARLGIDGVMKTIYNANGIADEATATALGKLCLGEYCYVGHFAIVCSDPGVTLDDLKAR